MATNLNVPIKHAEGAIAAEPNPNSSGKLRCIGPILMIFTGLVLMALSQVINPAIIKLYFSSDKTLLDETVSVLIYWGDMLLLLGCFISLAGITLFILKTCLNFNLKAVFKNGLNSTELVIIAICVSAFLIIDLGANLLDLFGNINDLVDNDIVPVLSDQNLASAIYDRMRLAYVSNDSLDNLYAYVTLFFFALLMLIVYILRPSRHLLKLAQLSKPQILFVYFSLALIFVVIVSSYGSYSRYIGLMARSFALLSLLMAPWGYILHKLKFDKGILYSYFVLLGLFVVVNINFFLGQEFACHDTKQGYHVPFLLLADALTNGGGIGWNSFSWGGEPLFIYSNFFLWAEYVLIIYLNKIFSLPTNNLFNIFFLYYIISYSTMCLIFFTVIFKEKPTAIILFAALLFGGLTQTNLGQFQLAGTYFIPFIALSLYLFLIRREWLYVGWAAFFLGVSANHYLPAFALWFIIAFGVASAFVVFVLKKRLAWHRIVVKKKYVWWLAICLLCLCVASTVLYLFDEIGQAYVSPSRGNATLDQSAASSQKGVFIGLDKYLHLLQQPMTSGPLVSAHDFQYFVTWHSVHYVGSFILLFAILSLFRNRSTFQLILLLLTGLVIIVAAGDNTPIWGLLTTYLPAFNLRHSFFFGSVISFLIITLAGYGIKAYLTNREAKVILACAVVISGILFGSLHGLTTDNPPKGVKAFSYPESRAFLGKQHYEKIPFCYSPYFAREAVVTHAPDDFIFFVKKEYLDAIDKIGHLLQGPMFFLATDRQLDSMLSGTPYFGEKYYADEINTTSIDKGLIYPVETEFIYGDSDHLFDLFDYNLRGEGNSIYGVFLKSGDFIVKDPEKVTLELMLKDLKSYVGGILEFSVTVQGETSEWNSINVSMYSYVEIIGGNDWWKFEGTKSYRTINGPETLKLHANITAKTKYVLISCSVKNGNENHVTLSSPRLTVYERPSKLHTKGDITFVKKDDPNHVIIQTKSDVDTNLIRRENWHSGWSAIVDGREQPILKTHGNMQKLALPAGEHIVEFKFWTLYPVLFWFHVIGYNIGYILFFTFLIKYGLTTKDHQGQNGDMPPE